MRKTIGKVCMILGAVLLIGAVSLFIFNQAEANRAERSSAEAVAFIKDAIAKNEEPTQNSEPEVPSDLMPSESKVMPEAEINGYSYIGYLSVPSQGLELPVMSSWNYEKLQVSPCRYSGTIAEGNLVVIAHNYSSHFGPLDNLKADDEVYFTDMKGKVTDYQVAITDVVPPASAEEVIAGDFDLALVTCTYSGKTRLVVYCNEK